MKTAICKDVKKTCIMQSTHLVSSSTFIGYDLLDIPEVLRHTGMPGPQPG